MRIPFNFIAGPPAFAQRAQRNVITSSSEKAVVHHDNLVASRQLVSEAQSRGEPPRRFVRLTLARAAAYSRRQANRQPREARMRREIRIEKLGPPVSHYTDAVQFGNLLFVSGMVSVDGEGKVLHKGDVAAQTRKIFENMKLLLETAGAGFKDVLKVTLYLRNIEDRPKVNPVRQEFFGAARPASTLVEVNKLIDPDLLIEIEAVVGLPQK
jgi:reactive intermediate/imine deaminase